jgi:putative transposase
MLDFQGKKGENVAKTLISACYDSEESKSRAYDVSPQTVRNYVGKQGIEVVEKLLEQARKMPLETLERGK